MILDLASKCLTAELNLFLVLGVTFADSATPGPILWRHGHALLCYAGFVCSPPHSRSSQAGWHIRASWGLALTNWGHLP